MLNRIVTVAALAAGGILLTSQLKKKGRARGDSSSTIEESIEVNVPLSVAYNQWTQFEQFPQFMSTVQEVKQIDDTHLHFKAEVGGKQKEWDAEITEQVPDKRIAWRSRGGVRNGGVVTFHKIDANTTRIMLQMDYEPEGVVENIGNWLGAVRMQTRDNLESFKKMLEMQGHETGAWRAQVRPH